ncbi:hypothetical protein DSM3645_18201 [Blastopirellula marina DSM 3645]|uniref:Uncharacterized protein n=1 Tax=Blastopirellula marina DSM 3645 TaxID=314230 RepID=A3ZYT4_9BACT|nr:hypothetical protein DSM3645_18201 [Blastopirellula marina DSM 3645]
MKIIDIETQRSACSLEEIKAVLLRYGHP